jgi:hypothetical protein
MHETCSLGTPLFCSATFSTLPLTTPTFQSPILAFRDSIGALPRLAPSNGIDARRRKLPRVEKNVVGCHWRFRWLGLRILRLAGEIAISFVAAPNRNA